jgi:hypothetical protein
MHNMQQNGQTRHRGQGGGGTKFVFRNGSTFVYSTGGNLFNFDDSDDDHGPFMSRNRGHRQQDNTRNGQRRDVRQNTTSMIISCLGQLFSLFLVFVFFVLPYLFPSNRY